MFLFSGPPFLVYAFWSFVALFLICVASTVYAYKKSKPNNIDATENTMDDNIDQSVPEESLGTPTTNESKLESATEEPIRTSSVQADVSITEEISLSIDSILKLLSELSKVAVVQRFTDIAELAGEIKFSEDIEEEGEEEEEEEEKPTSDVLREVDDSPYNDDDWDDDDDDDDDDWDDDDDDWDDDDDDPWNGGPGGASAGTYHIEDVWELEEEEFQEEYAPIRV